MRRRSPTKTSENATKADERNASSLLVEAQQRRSVGAHLSPVVRVTLVLFAVAFVAYGQAIKIYWRSSGASERRPALPVADPSPPTPSPTTTGDDRAGGGGAIFRSKVTSKESGEEHWRRQGGPPRGEVSPRSHPRIACLGHGGRALLRGGVGTQPGGGVTCDNIAGREFVPKRHRVKLYLSKPYERSFPDPKPYIDQSACIPAEKWQTTVGTNCNDFHEVDLGGSLVSNGDRNTRGDNDEGNDSYLQPNITSISNEWSLRLLGLGGWRSSWDLTDQRVSLAPSTTGVPAHVNIMSWEKYDTSDSGATDAVSVPSVVLKMLKWDHDFNTETYHRHRIDAIVSGRMSSSLLVVDAYGFCGQSTMNELAKSSLLRAVKKLNGVDKEYRTQRMKHASASGDNSTSVPRPLWPTLRQRIQYGRAAAHALAHLHTIDDSSTSLFQGQTLPTAGHLHNITIAHKDIKPDNFVLMNAYDEGAPSSPIAVKLGDFNDAELVYYNTSGLGGPCRFRRQRFDAHYPSPEEAWQLPLTPAVDIFGIGGVLFFILAGRKPYWDLNETFAYVHLTHGALPKVPDEVWELGEGEPALPEMLELVERCRSMKVKNRPSAETVAWNIDQIYSRFEERHLASS